MTDLTDPTPGFAQARGLNRQSATSSSLRCALSIVLWCLLALPAAAADLGTVLASAMQGTNVPAMGVLVMIDGKVAGEAVRGVRRNDGTDPVRRNDVWHIGSDAKAMTAAMIARLVERGVLSWTTPLEQMLPELAAFMRPQYRPVTLLQLLSHHSGLPAGLDDGKIAWKISDMGGLSLSQRRLAYIKGELQDAPVGPTTDFNYSNIGYIVAAVIAERATGTSYEALMRQEVFSPLGMSHVGFGFTHRGQNVGHHLGGPVTPTDELPPFTAPAGDLYMPLRDWALFCLDQLGGGRLLTAKSYALMQTAQPDGAYGLGWAVQPSFGPLRGPALIHAGSDGNWLAQAFLFPNTRSGLLVTANAADDMGAKKAEAAVIKALIFRLSPPAPKLASPAK
ncbi:MAG TPA: serine hydrolase domain-containing protein [Rhizomicrobium sp.]